MGLKGIFRFSSEGMNDSSLMFVHRGIISSYSESECRAAKHEPTRC
jgi:hypothetical protein